MNVIKPNLKWNGTLTPLNLKEVKFIVVHHAEHKTATIEEIHQWHLNNKWAGCGYNEYITKDGTVFVGRGDFQGAHTQNFNYCSIGICLQGDYEKETVLPEAQYKSLLERVRHHLNRLGSQINVVGHYELNATKCPGQYALPFLERLKSEAYRKEAEKVNDIDKALKVLVEKGVINSPDYWKKASEVVTYLKDLLIKFANTIK